MSLFLGWQLRLRHPEAGQPTWRVVLADTRDCVNHDAYHVWTPDNIDCDVWWTSEEGYGNFFGRDSEASWIRWYSEQALFVFGSALERLVNARAAMYDTAEARYMQMQLERALRISYVEVEDSLRQARPAQLLATKRDTDIEFGRQFCKHHDIKLVIPDFPMPSAELRIED